MSVETIPTAASSPAAISPDALETVQLSVIVPAYREGRRIYKNLTRLVGELDKLETGYEIVVVSDGNTDATVREAMRVESPAIKRSEERRVGKEGNTRQR